MIISIFDYESVILTFCITDFIGSFLNVRYMNVSLYSEWISIPCGRINNKTL